MKSKGELIIIPRDSFVNIFNDAIAEAKNDEERNVIKNILSELANLSKNTQ